MRPDTVVTELLSLVLSLLNRVNSATPTCNKEMYMTDEVRHLPSPHNLTGSDQ